MENNERRPPPCPSCGHHTGHLRVEGVWRGNKLYFRRRIVAEVVKDKKYPQMWRVKMPNGSVSDMVNLSRAKDAAFSLAGLLWGL